MESSERDWNGYMGAFTLSEAKGTTETAAGIAAEVRRLVADVVQMPELQIHDDALLASLLPGKMLRTQFGAVLSLACGHPAGADVLVRACAAVELVHTGTLCHDDVIDQALIRRSCPTLWRTAGAPTAVLIGDWFLCSSLEIIMQAADGLYAGAFLAKVREVCATEIAQELVHRGRRLDEATCLQLARGKTGPLFAFVGQVCAGGDRILAAAMQEAGYQIGTAYQLLDDLLDCHGAEPVAGKTLGTDALRSKDTMAQHGPTGPTITMDHVQRLCASALEQVSPWPAVRGALAGFLREHLLVAVQTPLVHERRVATAKRVG
jgi:geranylgeranyl pyrophosphate synthase